MKLSIGENIKKMRKTKDITQEQLAEMLGISCQSVSRWESLVCYPDMELLPVLAEIFEITVDRLLGVEDISEKKKIDEYLNRFQDAISKGKIYECICIAREGVAEYPNNYALLNKLMYALFVSGDDTGNISEWKENMEKYDAEITSLGERIMKYCPDENIRLEAIARLAFNHCEHGRRDIGRKIYESLPTMNLCRENQMWWSLNEDEKLPFLQKRIKESYDMLESFIWLMADEGKLAVEDSIAIINKLSDLNELICDGKQSEIISWKSARIPYDKAKLFAKIGNKERVFEQLRLAVKYAVDFDKRPEAQSFDCLLLGTVTENRNDFETSDSRPLREIIRDKWLANKVFDFVRDEPQFKDIIAIL